MGNYNAGTNAFSLIPAVGGVIQGAVDAAQSRRNVDRTIQANKELAEYQYSKDLEMWNRGNVYNAPEAQMDRLKKAGLNPNLVYGSGTVAGQAAGQLPKYNAPTVDYSGYRTPVDFPAMLQLYQDFSLRQAQTDNVREQVRINKAEADMREYGVTDYEGVPDPNWNGEGIQPMRYELTKYSWRKAMMNKLYGQGQIAKQTGENLGRYQGTYMDNRNKQIRSAIDKMDAEKEFTQKKNDWFLFKLFSDLGVDLLNTGSKYFGAGKWTQGAKGFSPGKGQSINPRYNSPESWRRLGY